MGHRRNQAELGLSPDGGNVTLWPQCLWYQRQMLYHAPILSFPRPSSQFFAAADPTSSLADALRPLLPDLSVGALLGFATGVALRHIGRVALIVVGTLFLTLQLLAYFELISVNWLRIQALTEPWLRQGSEQGGAWLSRVLTANLPFAGAFTGGLLLGLRARV